MNATKILSAAGIATAIVVGSMLAVTAASAHGDENARQERITELAERFNLDESEVKAFYEEKKAERQQEREAKQAEHLASLVSDGVLTQEQADALKEKRDELRETKMSLKEQDLTKEEWKQQLETLKSEFQAWADEQGINLDDIRPDKDDGFRKGRGFKHVH